MFSTLLESKPKRQRSPGSTVFSVIMHSLLIGGAVVATARASGVIEKPKQEDVQLAEIKKEPPPPEKPPDTPPPPEMPNTPPPPKGFQVLQAPVDIPDVIPKIDISKSVTNADDFTGKGVAGGVGRGKEGGTGPVSDDAPMFNFAVDKPALAIPGQNAPDYPRALQSAGLAGAVDVQFVVDTTGKADMSTFKVLNSPHDLFTAAVKNALPKYKYIPAEVNGKKVKVYVMQQFVFKIGG